MQQQMQQQMQPQMQQSMQTQEMQSQEMRLKQQMQQREMSQHQSNNSQNNKELINPLEGNPNINKNNVLRLPSRDIPMDTLQHTQDPNNNTDYIPPPQMNNYIENDMSLEKAIEENLLKNDNKEYYEKLYDELQTPLIISILFFIFQLPVFHKMFKKHFSFFITPEGSVTLSGHIFRCMIVGGFYYSTNRLINHLSRTI